ncbi:MAG: hypothetical protein R2733_19495 [Acidimicrobiales bacterium]
MTESRPDVNTAIRNTPLPGRAQLAKRSNLAFQAVRFVVLNLKILKLSRQHH